ncbi:MAG: class I SAM-dependent methyltransferase [Saprospiraceae bacterium]
MHRIFILSIFILYQCKEKVKELPQNNLKTDSTTEQNISTPKVVNENSDLQDRTIWQRPYEIIDLLGPLDNKVIADIGAGSGYFSFKFVLTAKKVIAIDIERELINLMNEEKDYYKPEIKSKFETRLARSNDPKLKKGEVDVIFLSNTYSYLNHRVKYLKNLQDKLKPGGKIMIVDFKKKITPIGPELKTRLAQGDVETELIDAGYHIVLSDDNKLKYQYIIIANIKTK